MEEKKLVRNEVDFPGNSDSKPSSSRETSTRTTGSDKPEREKQTAIVKGNVIKQKKSLGKKFSEMFFGDEDVQIGPYILHDIIIPTVKNMLYDMTVGSLEMRLFGERRGGSRNFNRNGSRTYTSYGNYYGAGRLESKDRNRDNYSRTNRARHDFDEVVFETRGEAEDVLSHLVDLTIDYGCASVADFYELSGIVGEHTDQNYGWLTLRDACTDRVRNGYILRLPRANPLD